MKKEWIIIVIIIFTIGTVCQIWNSIIAGFQPIYILLNIFFIAFDAILFLIYHYLTKDEWFRANRPIP